jgi:hypothetical protein
MAEKPPWAQLHSIATSWNISLQSRVQTSPTAAFFKSRVCCKQLQSSIYTPLNQHRFGKPTRSLEYIYILFFYVSLPYSTFCSKYLVCPLSSAYSLGYNGTIILWTWVCAVLSTISIRRFNLAVCTQAKTYAFLRVIPTLPINHNSFWHSFWKSFGIIYIYICHTFSDILFEILSGLCSDTLSS